jgi:hypothetical protein
LTGLKTIYDTEDLSSRTARQNMLCEGWQTQTRVSILVAGVGQREIALAGPLINKCMSCEIEQDNIASLGFVKADLRNQGFDKLFSCMLALDELHIRGRPFASSGVH